MLLQLKKQAELKAARSALDGYLQKNAIFNTRKAELERALDEAQTDEEIKLVSDQTDELQRDIEAAALDRIPQLEADIAQLESELEQIRSKSETAISKPAEKREGANMTKIQVRDLLRTGDYYIRSEVKEFYEKFKNLRAVGGEGLTIPEVVINRIMDILGDYSTMYELVDKIRVKGTARILIDTDTTAAEWIEQIGTLPEGDAGTITDISFDGYKIGRVTFVDNAMLEDSIINLDEYVVRKIARAIALGLDKAIINGAGSASKQPDGIIPKLPDTHKVQASADSLASIVKPLALIDTGEDSVGEIVCVMARKTYYNRLLEYSINTDSAGNVVGKLPSLNNVNLLGLRVVFNNNMAEDKILYGDFSKYTLVERESIAIDNSPHVRFKEDQMGFRGKGRFDGKPVKPKAFVLVTLTAPVQSSADPNGTPVQSSADSNGTPVQSSADSNGTPVG